MTSNGLRPQIGYAGDGLTPRPQYDFPSPSSNYGVGAPSPSFYPMAYQISPRFGASAFLPPPDVFAEGRSDTGRDDGGYTPREMRKRSSDVLNTDPVAMHLLVETAIGDSQYFDMLSVEEVEVLKQEQKVLDARLGTLKRKLESETKIRDATRSLTRLASKKGSNLGIKGSNTGQDTNGEPHEGLDASNKKVEEYIREILEIESRMRMIDMQLLMHTAAVLQLTHKGPKQRNGDTDPSDDPFRRPDSPASLDTYDVGRSNGIRGDDIFDERSFYRSPENLDSLMNVLQKGTHNRVGSMDQQTDTLATIAKRVEEMNERLKTLIGESSSEQNEDFARQAQGRPGASSVEQQLDILDQSLRNLSTEHTNKLTKTRHALSEVEGRLEGINNQLYATLSRNNPIGGEKILPPPPITGGEPTEQLNYMEDSFYTLEQIQYYINEQMEEMQSKAANSQDKEQVEKYETTIMGLWQIILAGEEEARERKRERRRVIETDPYADEQLSPDEDSDPNETFSLPAFSAKVQWLFSRASSLKDKQSVLMRQIKQQRELNSKSDAQKEAEFQRLNEQVMSARSEKMSMSNELDRAMDQLKQFDEQKIQMDSQVLRETQERNAGLEAQLINVQERVATFEKEVKDAKERAAAYEMQLKEVQERAVTAQDQLRNVELRRVAAEKELEGHQERSAASNVQARGLEERSASYEAQIRDAQERAVALEAQLREAQSGASTIQAELTQSATKLEQITTALKAASSEKEAAEARSLEATNTLNNKEAEFRNLESEIVRLTTELTFAKAELDGAYGTRAERAAESAAHPTIKKEISGLSEKNQALLDELEALHKVQDAASHSEAEARQSERTLKAELAGMAAEYEALTRDAIQNEKDRDVLEAQIDRLRDEKETLERDLSDEKVKWLGVRSPNMPSAGQGGQAQLDMGATSIRMLREDFRKMMRDRTAEGLKALRAEQEERRKLEALIRQMRKEALPSRSNLSRTTTA